MKNLLCLIVLLLCVTKVAWAEEKIFKVGVITALTGPAAANGIAMQNSILLARHDAPERFAHIQFIFEDGAFDSRQALTAFKKLKEIDGVHLVYAWGVTYCKPIAAVAEAMQMPVICQGIEQESYVKNPFLIRFMNPTDQYAKLLMSYVRSQGWKKIAVVLSENPYMEGMVEALKRQSQGEELAIVDRYPMGTVDMTSTVTKIAHAHYDAVAVFLAPGQIGQFYKLLARQKVKIPSFGSNCLENIDEIRLGEGTMEGAVYIHNEVKTSFIERYETAYHNRSQLAFGAMAYEFASLVGELFHDNASKLSPTEILQKFQVLTPREGRAMGAYRYVQDANGDRYFNFPFAVKKIHGETFDIVLR